MPLNNFKHLSLPNPIFFNFPDNEMDKVSLLKIVKKVEEKIRHLAPDTVITHYSHCLNIDHRITFEAVITACRPINNLSVKKILSFEIPSSTEWALFIEKCQLFRLKYIFYSNRSFSMYSIIIFEINFSGDPFVFI